MFELQVTPTATSSQGHLVRSEFTETNEMWINRRNYATLTIMDHRRLFMPVETSLGVHAMAKPFVECLRVFERLAGIHRFLEL